MCRVIFLLARHDSAIIEMRELCSSCNRIAPSQPSAPPTPPCQPAYPFQCLVSDYFHYRGWNYLVAVDRYRNWPIVEEAAGGSSGLIIALHRIFVTYGIIDELTSDGSPKFQSHKTKTFLHDWGVNHRTSSVAFPHSNCRAVFGVKIVKRLITDNTDTEGRLANNKFQRDMLQYHNTPDRDTQLSPAMCIFGRPIRDFIPIHPGKYQPHTTWRETLTSREEALRNRHMRIAERLTEHTRTLPPLVVGDPKPDRPQPHQMGQDWDCHRVGPPKTPPWVYQASPPDPTNPLPDKPAPQASLSPTVPQPDQSPQPPAAHEPTKAIPQALRNLMPHNAPSLKEWPTVDPTMSPLSTPSPGSPAPSIRRSTKQTRPPAMMN
ncbi:hypothetical protein Pcinc_001708 [Petrolisthes cinctipes]|uniref:Integrase catalytic domain-containing protein n=1 Tax=Petrolisthes cinctipes TaxID=88211 RepID=A0AAE1GL36_PETCI|nr:hypothetical protein Pcinc_001708 [Petrolisthes cinctipes]